MSLSRALVVVGCFLAGCPSSPQRAVVGPQPKQAINAELSQIFQEDQADRKEG
jgi:hypothetical protein